MSSSATRTTICSPVKLPPRLLAAYRATSYRACGLEVRIGRRVKGLARPAVFLTAWNPRSRRMPLAWNRRMQASLRARLAGCAEIREGEGVLRGWREEMLLAEVTPRRAAVLARRFRQHAIVVAMPDRPARLILL